LTDRESAFKVSKKGKKVKKEAMKGDAETGRNRIKAKNRLRGSLAERKEVFLRFCGFAVAENRKYDSFDPRT
jgi:hypothetical protein